MWLAAPARGTVPWPWTAPLLRGPQSDRTIHPGPDAPDVGWLNGIAAAYRVMCHLSRYTLTITKLCG
jgi:hypothetical protein